MKAIKFAVLGIIALCTIVSAKAQSVDEIVGKYVDALGGKDKISKITSLYQESTIEIMGNEASSTTTILNGKAFKNEMDFGGQKIVQCVTEKGGWSINPLMGQTTAEPMTDEQAKAAKDQLD